MGGQAPRRRNRSRKWRRAARRAIPRLRLLARERQDLEAEWQKRDGVRTEWLGRAPGHARRPRLKRKTIQGSLPSRQRIAKIGEELAAKFPDYAALASLAPLGAGEVQAQLGADEALVLFLDTQEQKPAPEETFIWVVTKTDLRWVRSGLGTPALAREVQALRCGLDYTNWRDSSAWGEATDEAKRAKAAQAARRQALHRATGAELHGRRIGNDGKPLPFDLARAHKLYQSLFGQLEDLLNSKKPADRSPPARSRNCRSRCW